MATPPQMLNMSKYLILKIEMEQIIFYMAQIFVQKEEYQIGEIVNIYTPEQISKMSSGEITGAINRDLAENAYDRQEKKAYTYTAKGLAEGLENILIICPRCGSYDTVIAKGDRFKCICCGLGGKMDEYGFLKGDGLPFSRVDSYSDWLSGRFDSDMEKAKQK